MAIAVRNGAARRVTLIGTDLDQAIHRCLDVASPFGAVRVLKPEHAGVREFLLEVGENGSPRLRWTFNTVDVGTQLSITRQGGMPWLPGLGRGASAADLALERKLDLLPHLLNLKVVVLGGGTGLYATLQGLRGRTSSLSAIISGRPARGDRKDALGALPLDDASMCLVALAPTVRENMALRGLLEHRMQEGHCPGAHFGTILLEALSQMRGSAQAALNEAGQLLGIAGRIILSHEAERVPDEPTNRPNRTALEAIGAADMIVLAPGHLDLELGPVLSSPGILEVMRSSLAVKVAVTKIMTAENGPRLASTSQELAGLATIAPGIVDVVLANSALFTRSQLDAYAAKGARPVRPDVEESAHFAGRVVTEQLVAEGNLARHDPKRLGESLIDIGTAALLGSFQ